MATGVIPARFASTRLPGKPLAEAGGRPLIQHVIEHVRRCRRLDRFLVATDDERILDAAVAAGAEAVLTRPDHPSGTDRMAEVAREIDDDVFLNIQGDEPEVAPETLDAVLQLLAEDPDLDIATAATPLRNREEFLSPNRVKVVLDARGRALYFSRSPIPHRRSEGNAPTDAGGGPFEPDGPSPLGHVGIYAFRKQALMDFVAHPPSGLERCEALEQLRALESGMAIGVAMVPEAPPGIDTLADLEAFRRRLAGG